MVKILLNKHLRQEMQVTGITIFARKSNKNMVMLPFITPRLTASV